MIAQAEQHPNQIAAKLIGRPYLSHSAVSAYQSCPLRYFYRYVAGLPEDTVSASLVFGGAIHKAVETHFYEMLVSGVAPSIDTLLAAYAEGWQEREAQRVLFGKNDDRTTLDELAGRMLSEFQQSSFAKPSGTILGIEEELTGQVVAGAPDMLARIDLLVDQGDCVVVTDLKTARSRWSNEQVQDSASQLLLYHELVRPLAGDKPIRLEFAVITKTKTPAIEVYDVPADPQQIERTKRIVERAWAGIQAGVFYPAPSPMQCSTCSFRDECRKWTG